MLLDLGPSGRYSNEPIAGRALAVAPASNFSLASPPNWSKILKKQRNRKRGRLKELPGSCKARAHTRRQFTSLSAKQGRSI